MVGYIVTGKLSAVPTSIKDLPSGKVKSRLEELDAITDQETFKREASFNTSFRFKAGYSKPIVCYEDKDDFFRCLYLHYLLLSALPEVEQFIEGLKVNNVLQLIRENPHEACKLFQTCEDEKLTAERVDQLFRVHFSPSGSNRRTSEEAISFYSLPGGCGRRFGDNFHS